MNFNTLYNYDISSPVIDEFYAVRVYVSHVSTTLWKGVALIEEKKTGGLLARLQTPVFTLESEVVSSITEQITKRIYGLERNRLTKKAES